MPAHLADCSAEVLCFLRCGLEPPAAAGTATMKVAPTGRSEAGEKRRPYWKKNLKSPLNVNNRPVYGEHWRHCRRLAWAVETDEDCAVDVPLGLAEMRADAAQIVQGAQRTGVVDLGDLARMHDQWGICVKRFERGRCLAGTHVHHLMGKTPGDEPEVGRQGNRSDAGTRHRCPRCYHCTSALCLLPAKLAWTSHRRISAWRTLVVTAKFECNLPPSLVAGLAVSWNSLVSSAHVLDHALVVLAVHALCEQFYFDLLFVLFRLVLCLLGEGGGATAALVDGSSLPGLHGRARRQILSGHEIRFQTANWTGY